MSFSFRTIIKTGTIWVQICFAFCSCVEQYFYILVSNIKHVSLWSVFNEPLRTELFVCVGKLSSTFYDDGKKKSIIIAMSRFASVRVVCRKYHGSHPLHHCRTASVCVFETVGGFVYFYSGYQDLNMCFYMCVRERKNVKKIQTAAIVECLWMFMVSLFRQCMCMFSGSNLPCLRKSLSSFWIWGHVRKWRLHKCLQVHVAICLCMRVYVWKCAMEHKLKRIT